jgi:hypothetical protein
MNDMTNRYRLTRRGLRGDTFYCVDRNTGKRTSLKTTDAEEARQLVAAKNQAERLPALNIHLARAYLAGADQRLSTRTWRQVIEAIIQTKLPSTKDRWSTAAKDRALAPLLPRIIVDTPAEMLLQVMRAGTVSTNIYLRRLHNYCVDMNWFLPR